MLVLEIDQIVPAAEFLAKRHHQGIFRRDKITPYIKHVEDVVNRVKARHGPNPVLEAIAWLHDTLEDPNVGGGYILLIDLREYGFPSRVTDAVVLLTHEKSTPYCDNITKLKGNADAAAVKLEDNLSNLSDKPTYNQIRKYAESMTILMGESGRMPTSWAPLYHEY